MEQSLESPEGAFEVWREYTVTYPTKYKRFPVALPRSDRRGSRDPIRNSEGLMRGILTVALESAKAATSDRW